MILETERLILRPWKISDAEYLYEYAKDPEIGPVAGWPCHTSLENSKNIIKTILSTQDTYAIVFKEVNHVVGCINIIIGNKSNLGLNNNEGEIGYWIGKEFWGKGLIPEAVKKIIDYSLNTLKLSKLWCGYFDGNEKSKRVQEKCRFKYDFTRENQYWPLINKHVTQHITCLLPD